MRKKLLMVSDAVTAPSGLARITRELAERIHVNLSDVIDVATCGYGGVGIEFNPLDRLSFELHRELGDS